MLSQEDYDGIGAAVAKALRGEAMTVLATTCKKCGKELVANAYAKVGELAEACPVCDKARLEADRAAALVAGRK